MPPFHEQLFLKNGDDHAVEQHKGSFPMSTKDQVLNRHSQLPTLETTVALDGDAVSVTVSAPAPLTRVAAQIDPLVALRNAVHNLDAARWSARECRTAVAASRENFNAALNAWNQTQPLQTVEDLKKEWIASNQAERVKRAEARQLQRPATVSETARAMAGGNMRRSPAAYRRGAFTRAEARTIEANKAAAARMNGSAAPRTKLPSER
jgi:hypothetical protein